MKNKTIIASILMLPLLSSIALACSCIYYENVEDKLNNAQYVFTGKVTDIRISGQEFNELQEATILINDYWKPSSFPESVNLKIYANKDTGANCGYNFEEGKEYLIYAFIDQETGKLTTNSCMGNMELNKAQDEIKELNELTNKEPAPEPIQDNIFTKFFKWLRSLFS